MTLSQWLDAEIGRAAAMAAHFGVTPAAISQWRVKVPRGRIAGVRDFTKGAVTLEAMLEAA